MAAITASMVGELRAKTDAPMMECKKALTEAEGNMDKAEELLRVKLGNKAGKAAARITAEGVVTAFVDGDAGAHDRNQLRNRLRHQERQLPGPGQRRGRCWSPRTTRPTWPRWARCPTSQDGFGPTLEDVRKGLIGKIGENMSFRRFKRFAGNGKLASYLHGTRIGVMVEFEGDDTAAKDVAMHVAAMKPVALSSADVPAELIEKERAVAAGKAEEDRKAAEAAGKPAAAGRDRRQAHRRRRAEVPEGSLAAQPALREERQADRRADAQGRQHQRSRASRCTWWAKASRRRSTTSRPKWRPRSPPPSGGLRPLPAARMTALRFVTARFTLAPANHTQGTHPCPKPAQPTSASC